MSLDERFNVAAEVAKNFTKITVNDDFVEIYALFKQSTVGDVNISDPGSSDEKAHLKYKAWSGKKGLSKDAAKEAYIAKVNEVAPKYK